MALAPLIALSEVPFQRGKFKNSPRPDRACKTEGYQEIKIRRVNGLQKFGLRFIRVGSGPVKRASRIRQR